MVSMKRNRQSKMLELIARYEINTQDELISLLRENGFEVTQATVSRDIRELKIAKIFGVKTFWDMQQNQEIHKDNIWQEKMIGIEMRVSEIEEYKNIAFFHKRMIIFQIYITIFVNHSYKYLQTICNHEKKTDKHNDGTGSIGHRRYLV